MLRGLHAALFPDLAWFDSLAPPVAFVPSPCRINTANSRNSLVQEHTPGSETRGHLCWGSHWARTAGSPFAAWGTSGKRWAAAYPFPLVCPCVAQATLVGVTTICFQHGSQVRYIDLSPNFHAVLGRPQTAVSRNPGACVSRGFVWMARTSDTQSCQCKNSNKAPKHGECSPEKHGTRFSPLSADQACKLAGRLRLDVLS